MLKDSYGRVLLEDMWACSKSASTQELIKLELLLDDDLLFRRSYPPEWEPQTIRALKHMDGKVQRADVARDVKLLCARILVKLHSQWPGVPQLLSEALRAQASYTVFSLISEYAKNEDWKLPRVLANEVSRAFSNLNAFYRALYWIDGPTRMLVKRARIIASGEVDIEAGP